MKKRLCQCQGYDGAVPGTSGFLQGFFLEPALEGGARHGLLEPLPSTASAGLSSTFGELWPESSLDHASLNHQEFCLDCFPPM